MEDYPDVVNPGARIAVDDQAILMVEVLLL
jgi:hypothetical protein